MQIRDAMHGDIKIEDDLILNVITTKEFQRLRKIKQLGLTYLVFPSAEHTRYSHSIGVYYLADKVLKSLESKENYFTNKERLVFKLAALLHDLGHGPLSHTAEMFFNYHHEDYSCKIIRDKETEINQLLNAYDETLVEEICQIIEKTHENKILVKLLSGSVDIDRMDYLQRDSVVSGVVYGSIEVERLIDQMVIRDDELLFNIRAVNMIEDFIIARYQMFSQVYLNKKSLAYEKLVEAILRRIKELYEVNYNFKTDISLLLPFLNKQNDEDISVSDYLRVNDITMMFLIEQMVNEEDELLVSLVKSYNRGDIVYFTNEMNTEVHKLRVPTSSKNKIYRDPVKVIDKQKQKMLIEDVSQLMKFAKEEMEIKVEEFDVYIKRS